MSLHSLHPQLFIFRAIKADGVDFTQCVTHGSFRYLWQETAYNMFHFVTLYVFPLLVMIFCYTCILTKINGQIHKSKGVWLTGEGHLNLTLHTTANDLQDDSSLSQLESYFCSFLDPFENFNFIWVFKKKKEILDIVLFLPFTSHPLQIKNKSWQTVWCCCVSAGVGGQSTSSQEVYTHIQQYNQIKNGIIIHCISAQLNKYISSST